MIKKLFNTTKEPIEEKSNQQVYNDFIYNHEDFNSLNEQTQQQLIQYIGLQCSPFISNNYYVRVTEEDILKHLNKEINIFVLQEHINYPTKNSPKEIYLGGCLWILDSKYLEYVRH